ncbi:hypothetical protein [Streptomyces sp. NPDC006140]|uniref:hypothetical protein n=1 Tax=Streptomyces sp. NPDC006140 TaxID=3154579 RepID=UPI0033E3C2E1
MNNAPDLASCLHTWFSEVRQTGISVESGTSLVKTMSQYIGRDVKQKKLSLRLLQEATRAEASRTNRILNAVLDLTDDEQEVLLDLLERTKLASIVRAAQTIADRSDFLQGLRGLLYADDTKTVFREVDQLHPDFRRRVELGPVGKWVDPRRAHADYPTRGRGVRFEAGDTTLR